MRQTNYLRLLLSWMWLMICMIFGNVCHGQFSHEMPLHAEKAFVFSATVASPTEIQAHWKIAPGYYIYRDRLKFHFIPDLNAQIHYPESELKDVGEDKKIKVFSGNLTIPITFQTLAPTLQLTVHYQGCSTKKFCYPPMQKTVTLNLSNQSSATNTSLLTDQNKISRLLATQHIGVLLFIFLGLGLLLAFTPCVLPMIPILMGIILGQKKPLGTFKAFTLSLAYVLGTAIIYAIAGVLAAYAGSSLQTLMQTPLVIGFTSLLFVLLALSLFGFYDIHLPRFWHQRMHHWSNKQRAGTYVGVFLMGMISSLIVSPCVTAPLVGVLIYIGNTGDMVLGASALFMLGIGMGIPLLLIGASAGKWIPSSGNWMEAVKKIFGFLLLAMAIWLFSRVASDIVTLCLWLLLVFAIAVFFGFYLPDLIGAHILNRSLAIILCISGIYLILMMDGLAPKFIRDWIGTGYHEKTLSDPFIIVTTEAELSQYLAKARIAHKPVLLDFYADWCESCISMDHKVFRVAAVQRAISQFQLLRVDLTNNTEEDNKILKKYNVIAPPTILFFDAKGKEMDSQRIVGEISAQEFLDRIAKIGAKLSS